MFKEKETRLRIKSNGTYNIQIDGAIIQNLKEAGFDKSDVIRLTNGLLIKYWNEISEGVELRRKEKELEKELTEIRNQIANLEGKI